jgi:ribosome-binding factor A
MRFRRVSRRSILSASTEVGSGDGLDPRFDRPDGPARVNNRKALQLCSQIARTLALVLNDTSDTILQNLLVESVVPYPTSVRLLVTVAPVVREGVDESRIAEHLEANRARLRCEVASAVHRRKVPDLCFRIAPRS